MNTIRFLHPLSHQAGRRDRRRPRNRLLAAVALALLVGALAALAGYLQSRLPGLGEQPGLQHALFLAPEAGPAPGLSRATEFELQKAQARVEPLPDQF